MDRPVVDRWLDELERQLCDPYVIDDPSLGTARIVHRARSLRHMRGAGRHRVLRTLQREVAGLASVYPRRLDVTALERVLSQDRAASRDSEATLILSVPSFRRVRRAV